MKDNIDDTNTNKLLQKKKNTHYLKWALNITIAFLAIYMIDYHLLPQKTVLDTVKTYKINKVYYKTSGWRTTGANYKTQKGYFFSTAKHFYRDLLDSELEMKCTPIFHIVKHMHAPNINHKYTLSSGFNGLSGFFFLLSLIIFSISRVIIGSKKEIDSFLMTKLLIFNGFYFIVTVLMYISYG